MQQNSVVCNRAALLFALNSISSLVNTPGKTLGIHNNIKFVATDGFVEVHGSDEVALAIGRCPADVRRGDFPDVLVPANIIDILNVWRGDEVCFSLDVRHNRINVTDNIEKLGLAAIFEKQENHIAGQLVSFGPDAYRQAPKDEVIECGRITSSLMKTIINRALVIPGETSGFSQGVCLRISEQFPHLNVSTLDTSSMFYWDVRDASFSFKKESVLVVPKSYLSNIPLSGNDIIIGKCGGSFFAKDVTGLTDFYCPQVAVDTYPVLSAMASQPHATTILAEGRELIRFCSLSNSNFQKTVGEDRGAVTVGRVRFTLHSGKLVLDTGGDLGDMVTPIELKSHDGPDQTMTFASSRLSSIIKSFPGSVYLGMNDTDVSTSHLRVWGHGDGGIYLLAPLRSVW